MRTTIALAILLTGMISCKKDKFNTVPEIAFKSINPNVELRSNSNPLSGPVLTIKLTDAEGDFGRQNDTTISYVYVKNVSFAPFKLDSFAFPDLSGLNKKNLNVDVSVRIRSVINSPNPPVIPHTDTMYFEVYVKDFANNKSNVIRTPDPVYFITQ